MSAGQRGGGFLELAGVRSGDEGAHGVKIHAPKSTRTTWGCGSPPVQLFDPPCRPCFEQSDQRQVVGNGRCGVWWLDDPWAGSSDGCGRPTRSAPTAPAWD